MAIRRNQGTRRTAAGAAVSMVLALLPVAGGVAATTGCAGPHPARVVSAKGIPVGVELGGADAAGSAPAPPPGSNPSPLGFPGTVQPPLPPVVVIESNPDVPPPPLAPRCGKPNYFASPKVEAKDKAVLPPQAATYVFRTKGTYRFEGKKVVTGRYPSLTTREIRAPKLTAHGELPDGTPYSVYDFDVVAPLATSTQTTHYRVVVGPPQQCQPHVDPNDPLSATNCERVITAAGLYITGVDTKQADGTTDTFAPSDPLQLVLFPLQRGLKWSSQAVDPTHNEQMQVDGENLGKADNAGERVYACSEPLDAWMIRITSTFTSAGSTTVTKGVFALGPQFGGLSLAEDLTTTGTQDGAKFTMHNVSTIMRVPLPAAEPSS